MTAPALSSILPREMTEFRGRPLFIFSIDVAKPSIIGKTPGGERRVGEITGGRFEGERLQGQDPLRRQRLAGGAHATPRGSSTCASSWKPTTAI